MTNTEPADVRPGYIVLPVRVARGRRHVWVAYVLALLGGAVGLHRFYLRRYRSGLAQGLLLLGGFFTIFIGQIIAHAISDGAVPTRTTTFADDAVILLSLLPHIALLVWVVADLFRIPRMAREENAPAAQPVGSDSSDAVMRG